MIQADQIISSEKLTAIFGDWPSFHDAEVKMMKLERPSDRSGFGFTLDALIHVFEMTAQVNEAGYYVLKNHTLAYLRFRNVRNFQMNGFNHQNAISEIDIVPLNKDESNLDWVRLDVNFNGAFGVDASFHCWSVEVVSVEKCNSQGEIDSL